MSHDFVTVALSRLGVVFCLRFDCEVVESCQLLLVSLYCSDCNFDLFATS